MRTAIKRALFGAVRGLGSRIMPHKRAAPPAPDNVRRIVISMLHGLGDVFYALSVLPALRRTYPHASIDVWVRSRCRQLADNHLDVNRVLVYDAVRLDRRVDPFRVDLRNRRSFIQALRVEHYDIAIDFSFVWESSIMLRLARPRFLAGASHHGMEFLFDAEYPIEQVAHTPLWELHAGILRTTGVLPPGAPSSRPVYRTSVRGSEAATTLLAPFGDRPIVALHTTAGWAAKEWSVHEFIALAKSLGDEDGLHVVVVGGGARDTDNARLLLATLPAAIDATQLAVDGTAAVLQRCACLVSGDSFPMHLAASMGVRCVSLFGPTNPRFFAPAPEVVPVYERLSCSAAESEIHCSLDAGRRCPDVQCMKRITVEEVRRAVVTAVKSSASGAAPRWSR